MDFWMTWLVFASVQLAATMAPGPAFVIAIRQIIVYGRLSGIFTAIGLGCGIAVHILCVVTGVSLVLQQSVWAFMIVKYVGAAYLFYIGFKAFFVRSKLKSDKPVLIDGVGEQPVQDHKCNMTALSAWRVGFLTNLLNPKAVVFFTAVYAQFLSFDTSFTVHMIYGFTSVSIEILWFICVSMLLANRIVKQRFMGILNIFERVCGGLLMGLGVKLALIK